MSALRSLIAAKLTGQRFALFFNTDEDNDESSGFVVDDQGRHWAYWTETIDGRESFSEWAEVAPEARWSDVREYQRALAEVRYTDPATPADPP